MFGNLCDFIFFYKNDSMFNYDHNLHGTLMIRHVMSQLDNLGIGEPHVAKNCKDYDTSNQFEPKSNLIKIS